MAIDPVLDQIEKNIDHLTKTRLEVALAMEKHPDKATELQSILVQLDELTPQFTKLREEAESTWTFIDPQKRIWLVTVNNGLVAKLKEIRAQFYTISPESAGKLEKPPEADSKCSFSNPGACVAAAGKWALIIAAVYFGGKFALSYMEKR